MLISHHQKSHYKSSDIYTHIFSSNAYIFINFGYVDISGLTILFKFLHDKNNIYIKSVKVRLQTSYIATIFFL